MIYWLTLRCSHSLRVTPLGVSNKKIYIVNIVYRKELPTLGTTPNIVVLNEQKAEEVTPKKEGLIDFSKETHSTQESIQHANE